MQNFDLIVIGAGSGLNVASADSEKGLKVAIVEKGPMGGTCLNRGCIPSKIIIHSADISEIITRAKSFGLNSGNISVNFKKIIKRATNIIDKEAGEIEKGLSENNNVAIFKKEAKFIGDRSLRVGNITIKGKKIVIAAGTRPSIPEIEGLKDVDFITSDEALRLEKQPKSLTILGGGYISAELAHFFGSLGTKINIIQKGKFLIPNEDGEISSAFTNIFRRKYNVLVEHNTTKISKRDRKFIVVAEVKKRKRILISDQLLVATGRTPNTDILNVEKTNVDVGEKGFIKTNQYLETTAKNIWALGDIVGKFLFKHSANLEAECVYNNAILKKRIRVDYGAMPHAIFSSPQVAGVGLREQDLINQKINFAVGRYRFINSGMGLAMQDYDGFIKIFAERKTKKILGCHILGSQAPTLIHEVVLAMKSGLTTWSIQNTTHIHPALSEVVQRAINSIEW